MNGNNKTGIRKGWEINKNYNKREKIIPSYKYLSKIDMMWMIWLVIDDIVEHSTFIRFTGRFFQKALYFTSHQAEQKHM